MDCQIRLDFSDHPSTMMHIDINSCFATIEQQANTLLRGKPIAVAAYDSPNGCILAPSIEAKRLGIKVGMPVKEGKALCPGLVVLLPDSDKYRAIHIKLKNLISTYTPKFVPKSIDEFVLDFSSTPSLRAGLHNVARDIKSRIRKEVGDHITVSIGIGPNRFLAKTASNLQKPDGLQEINKNNFLQVYGNLGLTDLCGISTQNLLRLNNSKIYTVTDFFNADISLLKNTFKSILGYYWFLRLRGWEIDDVDWDTKSFGHSYSLPKPFSKPEELAPILAKLVEKAGARMRGSGYQARGVHVGVIYRNHEFFHQGHLCHQPLFSSQDIYRVAFRLLCKSPYSSPVRNLSVSCFDLSPRSILQLSLFENSLKKDSLVKAIDAINDRWGAFVITSATMSNTENYVHDRIGFGNIKGL